MTSSDSSAGAVATAVSSSSLLSSVYRARSGTAADADAEDHTDNDNDNDNANANDNPVHNATTSSRRSSLILTTQSIRSLHIEYGSRGPQAAVRAAFDELDQDHKGYLTPSDLFDFFAVAADYTRVNVEDEVIHAAVQALLDDVGALQTPVPAVEGNSNRNRNDANQQSATDRGTTDTAAAVVVTFEQFASIFQRHPDLCRVFEDPTAHTSLRQSVLTLLTSSLVELENEDEENRQVYIPYHTQWKNQSIEFLWIAAYVGMNVAVFTTKAINYSKNPEAIAVFGQCILAARGAAACLNLNCMLILLPICRHLLTHLQATRLRHFIPFDSYLETHFLLGIIILLFVIVHVSAHVCDFYRFAYADEADIYALIGNALGPIPESPAARWKLVLSSIPGITGLFMVACMLVAYPTILVRRKRFNLFWSTHHLLIAMLIALTIHGTANLLEPYQSLYWVIGPLSLYVLGKLLRETPFTKCQVERVELHTGNVVHVQLTKPPRWNARLKAGMYGFLKIPQLSWWEWHPFTFSSSPDDPYIGFHFQTVGDWTTQAYQYLLQLHDPPKKEVDGGGIDDAEVVGDPTDNGATAATPSPSPLCPGKGGGGVVQLSKPLYFRVDGPMGASSQGFSDHPVVVLIGAGIGITPMISVLKHLLQHPGQMQQTYFYWTVRDPSAFQWFSNLLDDIYDHDLTHCLQLRHFVTSIKYDDRDLGAVLLAYAANAAHQKTNIDLLLGKRTRHQIDTGRPNWKTEFATIKGETKDLGFDECGIFLCGPTAMAKEIAKESLALSDAKFHFFFTKETF